jgi:hypothetical protein
MQRQRVHRARHMLMGAVEDVLPRRSPASPSMRAGAPGARGVASLGGTIVSGASPEDSTQMGTFG